MPKDAPAGQPNSPKETVNKAAELDKGKKGRQAIGEEAAGKLNAKEKTEKKFDYKEYIGKKLDADALSKLKEVRGTIKAKDVLNLQETNPNIVAELFCEPSDLSKEWTFKTYGNKSVEGCIGLVDVYRNDLSVRAVTVANKKGKTKQGKREGMGGNFYTGRGYIFIFEGYKVTPTEKLSENETKELNAKFEHETATQITDLKGKIPESLQKRFGDKLLPRLVSESVRQGVDSKYLLGLLQQENGADDSEFGVGARKGFLNQLRWAATIVKNNELRYEGFGKKAKDSRGNYTMGFLAFNSEKYAPSGASDVNKSHFPNLRQIYEKYAGTKLEGNQQDIDEGIKLAKMSRQSRFSRITSAAEVIFEKPELKETWDKIKDLLQKKQITFDSDIAQDGLSLLILKESALTQLQNPKTLEVIKKLVEKGWSFNLKYLSAIHNFANSETQTVTDYRHVKSMELEKASLTEALNIISETPQKHVTLQIEKGTGFTSDYAYRQALMSKDSDGNSYVRSPECWHQGIDINMIKKPVYAPDEGEVVDKGHDSGSGYWVQFKCKDGGDNVTFSFLHLSEEGYEKLSNRIKEKGKFFAKGEYLGTTDATGNATTKAGVKKYHLHLTVRRNGKITDPLPYLPQDLQLKIIGQRENPKYSSRYSKIEDMIKKHPKYAKNEKPRTEEVKKELVS